MKELAGSGIAIVIGVFIILGLICGTNACTDSKWNNGICIGCDVRYELRGVSNGMRYYVCPDCGQEVGRY